MSKHDSSTTTFAVEAVRAGRSFRDVADELAERGVKVSHETVRAWARKAGVVPASPPALAPALVARLQKRKAAAAPASEASDGSPPAPEPEGELDLEATLTAMLREAQSEAKAHGEASNVRASQAALTRATKLVHVLSQLDKRRPNDATLFSMPLADIEKGMAEMRSMFVALDERPVMCSACSRILSTLFGRGQVPAGATKPEMAAAVKNELARGAAR